MMGADAHTALETEPQAALDALERALRTALPMVPKSAAAVLCDDLRSAATIIDEIQRGEHEPHEDDLYPLCVAVCALRVISGAMATRVLMRAVMAADTESDTDSQLARSPIYSDSRFAREGWMRRAWRMVVCRRVCGRDFFNADASREIDRLTIENEALRERLRELTAESGR